MVWNSSHSLKSTSCFVRKMPLGNQKKMYYSMNIQGSPSNGRLNGSTQTSIGTQPSLPSFFDPIKPCSPTWILPMWSPTPMTRSERFPLDTTRSVKSLPSSTPRLMILRSPYLLRPWIMGISRSSPHIPSILLMPRIFLNSSVWKGERSF